MAFLTSCLLSHKRVAFHYGAQLGTEAQGTQVTRWDLPGISRKTPQRLAVWHLTKSRWNQSRLRVVGT